MDFKSFINNFIFLFQSFFKKKNKHFVYVSMGDSTVEGIGASHPSKSYTGLIFGMIKQQTKHARHFNLGKNGATSEDVLENQLRVAVDKHPDIITLSIGANDIRLRVSRGTFEKHLQTILQRLTKDTSAKIIINNIPNFSVSPRVPMYLRHLSKLQIQRFNRVIAKLAVLFDITYVDLFSQTSLYAKTFPEVVSDDQFHPSDFGYALWANTIITAISSSDLHSLKM